MMNALFAASYRRSGSASLEFYDDAETLGTLQDILDLDDLFFSKAGIGLGHLCNSVHEFAEFRLGEIHIRLFAPLQNHLGFYPMSFGHELDHVSCFKVQVVSFGADTEAYVLCFYFLLPGVVLPGLFRGLVAVLPVIHDLADGGIQVRGNLDQIQFSLACNLNRFGCFHKPQVRPQIVDDRNFGHSYLLVDPKVFCSCYSFTLIIKRKAPWPLVEMAGVEPASR